MKKYFLLIIVAGAVFVGTFYWIFIRPSQVRSQCWLVVKDKINAPGEITRLDANDAYRFCLTKHGLKPEDIITR